MLKFTCLHTDEDYDLFVKNFPQFEEKLRTKNKIENLEDYPKNVFLWTSIYLHGEIEKYAGYDIAKILEGDWWDLTHSSKPEKCKVYLPNGTIIKCLAYIWEVYPKPIIEYDKKCSKEYTETLVLPNNIIDVDGKKYNQRKLIGLIITPNSKEKKYAQQKMWDRSEYL